MDAEQSHDATFYVRIKAKRGASYFGSKVERITGVTLTQKKPDSLLVDEVAVKLTVRLPDAVFDALTPEAVIIVPAELVQKSTEVEATAGEPS